MFGSVVIILYQRKEYQMVFSEQLSLIMSLVRVVSVPLVNDNRVCGNEYFQSQAAYLVNQVVIIKAGAE